MSQYNNAQMRKWIAGFFENEEDFDFFCEDQFPDVFEQFTDGDSLNKKARALTKYCEENNQYDALIEKLKDEDPDRFDEFSPPEAVEDALEVEPPAPAEPPTPDEPEPPEKPESAADVFISYSRRDEEFIKGLYGELTRHGISAWYDRKNIGVATHWPTEIVEGIKSSKVFLLVVSPDSTASVNVRKEVDLAQRYQKQIIPLIWRPTDIPVAMEYQLAGIQWVEFNESTSADKINQLTEVLNSLIGGASMQEAVSNKAIVTESNIPIIEETAPAAERKTLGGLKKKKPVSPAALGGAVISSVVTRFGLDAEDQDFVNGELKWLFSAADNFLQVQRGDSPRSQPVSVSIPANAGRDEGANNTILSSVSDFDLQIWQGQIESAFKRVQIHLKNLDILLEQEANKGDAGKGDVYLQNQIKNGRLEIVKVLQELAQIMKQAYGIFVASPNQLVEYLQA